MEIDLNFDFKTTGFGDCCDFCLQHPETIVAGNFLLQHAEAIITGKIILQHPETCNMN